LIRRQHPASKKSVFRIFLRSRNNPLKPVWLGEGVWVDQRDPVAVLGRVNADVIACGKACVCIELNYFCISVTGLDIRS